MKKKYTILISGATGTGKSSFAIKLAQQLSGEVINADIGSFYEPLTIGTAKPDWKNEEVPHHMFDILKKPELYSIVAFRERLQCLIEKIWQRGKVPIVVGGSAFYIKAFFYKQPDIQDTSDVIKRLEKSSAANEVLWQKLKIIDAQRAKAIDPQDRYRVIRALAIFEVTGKKPSSFKQQFDPLSPYYFVVCHRDREELYQRIDNRVTQMIDDGWVEEVASLRGTEWEDFLIRKKMIGYDDILQAMLNGNAVSDIIPIIQQKTRNYAKRQVTFLKKLQKDLQSSSLSPLMKDNVDQLNLTLCDVGLYIKQLVLKILKVFG